MSTINSDILITKVTPPFLRLNMIHRDRLVERLVVLPEIRLWLVSGPAGYGKTTLLADWHQFNVQRGVNTAWFSLDPNDNEPLRFLRYLGASFQIILEDNAEISNAMESFTFASNQNMEGAMIVLINSINKYNHKFLLIFDDYHVIVNPAIHHAMGFLLDNLPPCLQIAIGTRADPPLPITRLRSRGQLSEIRLADLRFSPVESEDFLTKTLHLNLTASEIQSLEKWMEGWAAGLQLCGLSMQNWPEWTEKLLSEPAHQRPLMEYLSEEVFQKLPGPIQSFLQRTCLLDELNVDLCKAVLQNSSDEFLESNSSDRSMDAQSALEWLDHANIFVIPLDPLGKHFRYHAIFAEYLQDNLNRSHPEWIKVINRKASEWYWQQKNIDQAIRYAIKSGDLPWFVHLVEQSAMLMLLQSKLTILNGWLEKISSENLHSNPYLLIISAWISLLKGQINQVEPILRLTETALENQSYNFFDQDIIGFSVSPQTIRWMITMIQANLARINKLWEKAIHLSKQVLDELPSNEQILRCTLLLNLGRVYQETYQVDQCRQILTETVEISKISSNIYVHLYALVLLGQQAVLQGKMSEAKFYYSQALAFGYRENGGLVIPAVSLSETWLGDWFFIQNQLDEAKAYLDRAILLAELCGEFGILKDAYLNRMKVNLALGDLNAAQIFLDKVDHIQINGISESKEWIEAQKALVWLAQGRIREALEWAEHITLPVSTDQINRSSEMCALAAVRVYLKAEESGLINISVLENSLETAHFLLTAAEAGNRTTVIVEILILKAGILKVLGQVSEAYKAWESARRLANPNGWTRLFLDAPEKIDPGNLDTKELSLLAEPLSERELDLLRLIMEGATNQEIATRLFITVGTVKSHLNHIFGKMGVKTRTEAAAKARSLKLF